MYASFLTFNDVLSENLSWNESASIVILQNFDFNYISTSYFKSKTEWISLNFRQLTIQHMSVKRNISVQELKCYISFFI